MFKKHAIDCPDGPCTACVALKFKWSLRQLLPLTYRSTYKTADGTKHFAVWRMWFGKVFSHDEVLVKV